MLDHFQKFEALPEKLVWWEIGLAFAINMGLCGAVTAAAPTTSAILAMLSLGVTFVRGAFEQDRILQNFGTRFGSAVAVERNVIAVGQGHSGNSGAVHIFDWNGTYLSQRQRIPPPISSTIGRFGGFVALSSDLQFMAASRREDLALHVFKLNATGTYEPLQNFVHGLGAYDGFGFVADFDTSSNRMVVGSVEKVNPAVSNKAGAVYAYTYDGTNFVENEILFSPNPVVNSRFGTSLSLSGGVLAVGTYYSTTVDIFKHNGSAFVPDGPALNGTTSFGRALSLDGSTLAVGAPLDDTKGSQAGAVFIYVYSGGSWALSATLYASDASTNARFGEGVVLKGNALHIGAGGAKAVYAFKNSGGTWAQQDKLTPSPSSLVGVFGAYTHFDFSGGVAVVGVHDDGKAFMYVDPVCPLGRTITYPFSGANSPLLGVSLNPVASLLTLQVSVALEAINPATQYVLDVASYGAQSNFRNPTNCENRLVSDVSGTWADIWAPSAVDTVTSGVCACGKKMACFHG